MYGLPLAINPDLGRILKYLRPPEPSHATLWWMFATVVGVALFFVIFEIISRGVRRNREMKKSFDDFNQLALVCQLTPDEINLLRDLISVCDIQYPDRLFTSFELFNRCVEDMGPGASGPLSESYVKTLRIIRNKIFFGERLKMPPIRSTHELKPNQWLHLKRKADSEVFMTPVVEAGPSGLLVATPKVRGESLQIRPGEHFEIYFWRDRDASYHFTSEVTGQIGVHHLITILKHVDDVERIQRRQYHRVDISIPVQVIPVPREELDSMDKAAVEKGEPGLRAYLINISGSGFALAARAALKPNDLVYFELPTGEEGLKLPVIAKILAVSKREATDEFLMNGEFAGLSTDTHEQIFKFIYSQEKQKALARR